MKLIQLLEIHKQSNILTTSTILKYESVVRSWIKDTKIDDIYINYKDIIIWRNNISKRVTTTTCNNYHRHMKALLNTAVKLEYIEKNAFTQMKMLKTNSKPTYKLIDDETLEKLISTIKSDVYYSNNAWFHLALINVLATTGIRRRQLIGITKNDINFDDKTLFLSPKFSKNRNSNLIPLKNDTLNYLHAVVQKSKGSHSTQVFNITQFSDSYKKNYTTEEHISQLFRKWSAKIGVKVSPHRFRHTFITKLANSGTNLKTVQQIVGHSDVKTTLSYVYSDLSDMRKALENL
jgi:integrase